MSNIYRVTGGRAVLDIEPGAVGELDLSEEAEADLLDSGRLAIEPREYEVVGPREVAGAKPGSKFRGAFRVPHERALIDGGHIERVAAKQDKPTKPAAQAAGKE